MRRKLEELVNCNSHPWDMITTPPFSARTRWRVGLGETHRCISLRTWTKFPCDSVGNSQYSPRAQAARSNTNMQTAITDLSLESTYSKTSVQCRAGATAADEAHNNEQPEPCSKISGTHHRLRSERAHHDFFPDQKYLTFRTLFQWETTR